MNKILLLLFSFLHLLSYGASDFTDLNSLVKAATIYHNGAKVEKEIHLDIPSGTYKFQLKNVSSKIHLKSLKFENKDITILHKTLIKKMSDEEKTKLEDKQFALKNQLKLLEAKFADRQFIQKVDELEQMLHYYDSSIVEIKEELREIDDKLERARELDKIQLNNPDAAILQVMISSSSKIKASVPFSYLVGGIGWSPFYEVSSTPSSTSSLRIKFIAKLMSQTGEDWKGVELTLSSASPLEDPTKLPHPDKPWTIYSRYSRKDEPHQNSVKNELETLKGIEYDDIEIPANIGSRKISGNHDILSNSTVFSFPVFDQELSANYYHYAYPSIDPDCFLVAAVTGWDTLNLVDGMANISVDGKELGKSLLKFSQQPDTLIIPLGKDPEVSITREEVHNDVFRDEKAIGKKETHRFSFEITAKNNHNSPILLHLYEQVPISQTNKLDVKLINSSDANKNEEIGELKWIENITPSQSISKEISFEITGIGFSAIRGPVMPRKAKYRVSKNPRFY